MYRLRGATAGLFLTSTLAMAQSKPDQALFELKPNPAFLTCLSGSSEAPHAWVAVKRGDLNDTAVIHVKGLKPNLDFDLFTVQRSSLDDGGAPVKNFKGFGLAWYQSDLHSDGDGNAKVTTKTILLDQIFGFDADVVATQVSSNAAPPALTVLKPTNTFHMGFWLAGCEFQAPQKCLRLIKVYAINFMP